MTHTPLKTVEGARILRQWQMGIMSAKDVEKAQEYYVLKSFSDEKAHDVWYDIWTIRSEYIPD